MSPDSATDIEALIEAQLPGVQVINAANQPLIGAPINTAKSSRDTIIVFGGPGTLEGKFEDAAGMPDEQGWVGIDLNQIAAAHWNISDYQCAELDPETPDNHAWWCGEMIPACDPPDIEGGYGNDWHDYLDWYGTVPDPNATTTVTLEAVSNIDTEPGYDFVRFQYEMPTGFVEINAWDGPFPGEVINEFFTVDAASYVGADNDQVHLRFEFTSDGAWSDEDCNYPTTGAMQLDQISVFFNDVQAGQTETCEPGDPVQWSPGSGPVVGDFSKVWPRLDDGQPCQQNDTPQFAFIDDGEVVPGTGGTLECTYYPGYGPGGYAVNIFGGLNGYQYEAPLDNQIWSPPITWPSGANNALLCFDAYLHTDLGCVPNNLVFAVSLIRSTSDPAGADGWSDWNSVAYFFSGEPMYYRAELEVTDLLVPDTAWVQIALGAFHWYIGAWCGYCPTPAPYFDNVCLKATTGGPVLSARDYRLAQDSFPASGTIDYANLGQNHVHFNAANGDPGLTIDIKPGGPDAQLVASPLMYYRLQTNPLFDPYRTNPTEGSVAGVHDEEDIWLFDLPDEGLFFPGDVLHYYFEAKDERDGQERTSRLPHDISGFDNFTDLFAYPPEYTVRALPSLRSTTVGDHPTLLIWDDADGRGRPHLYHALGTTVGEPGVDYDLFRTTAAYHSRLGNSLGDLATADQLLGFQEMVYRRDNQKYLESFYSPQEDLDKETDVTILDAWLRQGDKDLALFGDGLMRSWHYFSDVTSVFVDDWLNIDYEGASLADLIDNQRAPGVLPLAGNPVFTFTPRWVASGACPEYRIFNAIIPSTEPGPVAVALAEFTDPDGSGDAYPFAAGVLSSVAEFNSRILTFPYDFSAIQTSAGSNQDKDYALPLRNHVLGEILTFWETEFVLDMTPVGIPAREFAVSVAPNPFNPRTTIEYAVPHMGKLTILIFDLQGKRVRTLCDEQVEAGIGSMVWNGDDDNGRTVAAGVYFCQARVGEFTRVNKVTLLK